MSEYVLADGAEDDLEKIAEYTIDRWGVEQARKYGAILAVFHENMDLPSRLQERLDDENRLIEGE